jgi:DNA primase catalytic core
MAIPRETVEQILQTARIEEVVGEFVTLKKRGANLIGVCPFHNEKTPSFNVNPARNIFKCFGCGKAGDSAKFLMEHEHFTYPEALRYLAKKYNIKIEEKEQTAEELMQQSIREKMFNINEFADKYFVDTLWNTEEGKTIGLEYFRERGYLNPIIEKFHLGYNLEAPKWDAFTEHAKKNGYAETILGRRRYLRDINSANSVVRGFAERNAINAPIQGSSADMIKIAMIGIHEELQRLKMQSKMILQVHDELVFDAHFDELNDLKAIVQDKMVNALPLSVPVVVEMNTGNNWLEAH